MDRIYWRLAGFLAAGGLMVSSDGRGLGCYFSGLIMGGHFGNIGLERLSKAASFVSEEDNRATIYLLAFTKPDYTPV